MTRTCDATIPAFISHTVPLPVCCPVSANPRPSSTLRVSYLPRGVVLPVEDLASWVGEYVDGHPSGVRNMEEMVQDIARRVSASTGVRVRAVADLRIRPPFGGEDQTMRVSARATPEPS